MSGLVERILSRVPDRGGGCWVYPTTTRPRVKIAGRNQVAARVLYEELRGSVPTGAEVHHTCENQLCVNPLHLDAVPVSEHRRMHARSRPRPPAVAHPSLGHYTNGGCRCPECKAIHAAYQREFRRRRREAVTA